MKSSPAGSALLTSLLVVAIATMLASAVTWKSFSSIIRAEAQQDIAQARWISKAAIDYARWILIADSRGLQGQSAQIDHLQEPWAQEIPYSKLDQLFTSKLSKEDQYFLSLAGLTGQIKDEQSKFNLARITDQKNSTSAEKGLKILFQELSIHESKFNKFLSSLKKANSISNRNNIMDPQSFYPIKNRRKDLLNIISSLKLNMQLEKKLIDTVTWLPKSTPININTASIEVITATLRESNKENLTYLFETVRQFPFRSLTEVSSVYNSKFISKNLIDVKSDFFLVTGYVHFGKAEIGFSALLRREGHATQVIDLDLI
jgi:general secretion pathway protein K